MYRAGLCVWSCVELVSMYRAVCVYGLCGACFCIELSVRMDLVLCGSCYCVCMSVVRSASEMYMCVVRS